VAQDEELRQVEVLGRARKTHESSLPVELLVEEYEFLLIEASV
jgi:hypothetical protein